MSTCPGPVSFCLRQTTQRKQFTEGRISSDSHFGKLSLVSHGSNGVKLGLLTPLQQAGSRVTRMGSKVGLDLTGLPLCLPVPTICTAGVQSCEPLGNILNPKLNTLILCYRYHKSYRYLPENSSFLSSSSFPVKQGPCDQEWERSMQSHLFLLLVFS